MEQEKIMVIGQGELGKRAVAQLMMRGHDNVELVNTMPVIKPIEVPENMYVTNYPFVHSIEKKRTNPCKRHEYILRSGNRWICKHCDHILKP